MFCSHSPVGDDGGYIGFFELARPELGHLSAELQDVVGEELVETTTRHRASSINCAWF